MTTTTSRTRSPNSPGGLSPASPRSPSRSKRDQFERDGSLATYFSAPSPRIAEKNGFFGVISPSGNTVTAKPTSPLARNTANPMDVFGLPTSRGPSMMPSRSVSTQNSVNSTAGAPSGIADDSSPSAQHSAFAAAIMASKGFALPPASNMTPRGPLTGAGKEFNWSSSRMPAPSMRQSVSSSGRTSVTSSREHERPPFFSQSSTSTVTASPQDHAQPTEIPNAYAPVRSDSPFELLSSLSPSPVPSTSSSSTGRSSGSSFSQLSLGARGKDRKTLSPSSSVSSALSVSSHSAGMPSKRAPVSRPGTALSPSARMQTVASRDLPALLESDDVLLLDLRSRTAFSSPAGRIKGSINICVPTTLLRRPIYDVNRVAETIVSKTAKQRFLAFVAQKQGKVVCYDQDLQDSTVISILSKFERHGFAGELRYVEGGWSAMQEAAFKTGAGRDLSACFELGTLEEDSDMSPAAEDPDSTMKSSPVIRCHALPSSAFESTSTASYQHGAQTAGTAQDSQQSGARSAADGQRTGRKQTCNPFFDNIRQNAESLSLERSLAHLNPVELPAAYVTPAVTTHLPPFLSNLVQLSPTARARKLATEFFEIEQAEQRRLQAVMDWHASTSGLRPVSDESSSEAEESHPLSIAAGVEKGHLNRYKNIFPYDHARVRLAGGKTRDCDYINASHVRLRASTKSYIATQGPLDSTFAHFWQLVWQEKVSVIVMLTHLVEAGRAKCGNYFKSGQYDDILVDIVEQSCPDPLVAKTGDSFFGSLAVDKEAGTSEDVTIRRKIALRNVNDPPGTPPRYLRHIQYIAWPDFDVPPEARELVELVKEVNAAEEAVLRENGIDESDERPPVLAHCSAGVGRTGTYIVVDALLDLMRRERQGSNPMLSPSKMDIDLPQMGTGQSQLMARRASQRSSQGFVPAVAALSLDSPSRQTPPLCRSDPIRAAVDELRLQRMSMIANSGQFVFAYLSVLEGLVSELRQEGRLSLPSQ
ncbi:hypothetical protein E5Q_02492 [Mixia osmundae IAM 14324]|uniref:protein-tyrosine-phosphatase n=2 Tax=Mixia osmundae (strain CBS 9802 / IAM 14324 / JCM 22182 / KY 12970) TaxID=764103 RepID=G7DZ25_MIXOS|nr:hypothetical protein E5Q_02492 [Mixia osmundae IAM 14324]